MAGGGATLEEVGIAKYCTGQLEQLRQLRAQVETVRNIWQSDNMVRERWTLANHSVDLVARKLRTTAAAAVGLSEVDRLSAAATQFREILVACGSAVPDELQQSERISIADQSISLGGEQPTLWLDGIETLSVKVGVAGQWSNWTEVEDFLTSHADDQHYVVEIDNDGYVTLKFGDGTNGARLPADCQVMVNQVTGDPTVGDLGARSLNVIVAPACDEFITGNDEDPTRTTTNPVATTGWRAAEPLSEVAARIARAQSRPAIPVTVSDYQEMLEDRADVAEAAVWVNKPTQSEVLGLEAPDASSATSTTRVLPYADVARTIARAVRNRVNVVIRPAPEQDPALVMQAVCNDLSAARLCGTVVWATLAEPLYISVRIIVEVHPEIAKADLRLRLRAALLALFGPDRERILGCARTCAEVYANAEGVPGVLWSQVVGFDRAGQNEITVQESITPARNEVIRCLDISGEPLCGAIIIWVARRYRLEVQLAYSDPDDRPSTASLIAAIKARLSGPDSVPVQDAWRDISVVDVDTVLSGLAPPGQKFRLRTLSLIVEQQKVERLSLDSGDVPILDYVQIRDKSLSAHYRLELEVVPTPAGDGSVGDPPDEGELCAKLYPLLSGSQSVPATEGWPEITASLLEALLGRTGTVGGWNVSIHVLAIITGQGNIDRLSLACDQVPILDALHLALRRSR